MNVKRYWVVGLCLAASLASAQTEHVVVISLDGVAAYELEDEDVELPNLRELIETGVWAESSETVFPSVTHPSHTTLVTGVLPKVHGVVGNTLVNRETGERFHITNKPHKESVRVRTIFDAAKDAGKVTAAFYWPESWQDPSIDYNIPEVFDGDTADPRAADPAFLRELRDAGIPIDFYYRWYKDKARKGASDAILADAAAYVIGKYQPDLLAIHFLVTDEIQHAYGTEHYRSKEALTVADNAVGIVRAAIAVAGLTDTTTFFIVADHGFHTIRYEVNVGPLVSRHSLADRVRLHPGGWTLWVDVLDPGVDLEPFFADALSLEGVDRILRPEDFDTIGFPRYEQDPHVRGQYAILGDIDTFPIVDPSSSSTARRERAKPSHEHGYLPSHPRMYPAFIASGAGVREGVRVGHVRNLDVAPTIAHLLGLELPGATGVVMEEILVER